MRTQALAVMAVVVGLGGAQATQAQSWQVVDRLAMQIHQSANDLCWDMRDQFQGQPGFQDVYSEAKQIWTMTDAMCGQLGQRDFDPHAVLHQAQMVDRCCDHLNSGLQGWMTVGYQPSPWPAYGPHAHCRTRIGNRAAMAIFQARLRRLEIMIDLMVNQCEACCQHHARSRQPQWGDVPFGGQLPDHEDRSRPPF